MKHQLFIMLLFSFTLSRAKDEDLPLCPLHFQFLPQKLPMHCRMPTKADLAAYPGMEGLHNMLPQPGKYPVPMPAPLPPGMPMPPGMPVPMPPGMPVPMPPGMPVPMPQGMPGPAPMPMPGGMPMMPMPGPMMPMPGQPGHKVPVIVMPFYSPDKSYKKPKRPKKSASHDSTETSSEIDTDTETETDTDTSDEGWWKGKRHGWRRNGRRPSKRHHSRRSRRRHNKKKNSILTPVLQYVTNDGYVIYEKTISKGEAKDWLRVNKDEQKPDVLQKPEEQQEDMNRDGNASVHEEQMKVEVKKEKSTEDDGEKDEGDKEDERDKEEVTTVVAHVKRHHRQRGLAINKLLPKRAF